LILSNDEISIEIYLPLKLTLSEPDQVTTSTTDQPQLPLLQTLNSESVQKLQYITSSFGYLMPMKLPSAPPLLAPSTLLPMISLSLDSIINSADY